MQRQGHFIDTFSYILGGGNPPGKSLHFLSRYRPVGRQHCGGHPDRSACLVHLSDGALAFVGK